MSKRKTKEKEMPTPEVDPEFQHILDAIDTLERCAVEHESRQTSPHKGICFDNRSFIVAMAIHRMGMTLSDLGFIAEHLVDIECNHANAEEGAAKAKSDTSDDVLDAKELSGL